MSKRELKLTVNFEVGDTGDLSRLVTGGTLVDALILGEGSRNVQSVKTMLCLHLEILGRLDDSVVVIPLYHWI